jgi:hypothetical protein
MNERSKKDWKTIRELHSTEFLPEKLEIDNAIDELEWKKKYVGIIIHEGKAYILALPHAYTSERDNQIRYLQMPNFLDEVSSYENALSRLLEFKVGEFFRQRYNYSKVLIRYKPV